jgi:hypothetical protein
MTNENNTTFFNIGDTVEVIKEPVFVGAKGSKNWKVSPDSISNSFLVRYDMSHLVGEVGTVIYYTPNMFVLPEEKSKKMGLGFYLIDFRNKNISYPVGLEGFSFDELKLINDDSKTT